MTNLKEQLEYEQEIAIKWINLYKDSHPMDLSFWQGYLSAINKLIELKY